ncbi:MAG: 50S ribosomal protein L11 methyltransferase [Deltaproteobacteria bacterium]|nr:50S ribosomal protein L11 methyltransferase [Deltaproteobacteria bacterium]
MYSLLDYGTMIRATPRRDAYVEALRRTVRPGSLVVEIGAGPGFFSVLAAKLGAEHVFAVDPDEAVHVGKAIARDNGVADRITFVQGKVEDLELPRPADVIVADLRGVLPFMQGHFTALAHARRSLLAPGGVLIPARDTLWAAPVEDAEAFATWADPWLLSPEGVSLAAARAFAVSAWTKGRVQPPALLAPARPWLTLDYASVEAGPQIGRVEVEATRCGVLHGVCAWFDAELVPGVGFSNAPGSPPLIYGNALFPLEHAPQVEPGARVAIEIGATPVNDGYDWKWRVTATAAGATEPFFDERHHTMMGRPLAPLAKHLAKSTSKGAT